VGVKKLTAPLTLSCKMRGKKLMGKDKTAPLTFILSRKGREESEKFSSKTSSPFAKYPKICYHQKTALK